MSNAHNNPYTDQNISGQMFLREFAETVNSAELVWHRDHQDRQVTVVEGSGWHIQFDNQLPMQLKEGQTVFVPKNTYHRLHKGNGRLVVKIQEFVVPKKIYNTPDDYVNARNHRFDNMWSKPARAKSKKKKSKPK
jgi:mannose-6-phosphate isomerase-like protein (cupin superfamily)